MINKILIFLAAIFWGYDSYAQTNVFSPTAANDGVRFSTTNYGSSSRFRAMGNAQMGTGGDISSLGGNPAGLGMFTRSEFVFTPEINNGNFQSEYLGNYEQSKKSQLNLGQVGAVFFIPTYKNAGEDTKKGLIGAAVGIGYNRTNDFGFESSYGGINDATSINNMLYNNDDALSANRQSGSIGRTGSNAEFSLAGALNISNQIYLGASLNLTNSRFNADTKFNELGAVQGGGNYSIDYFTNQTTKGAGVNARLGIVFKPVSDLRIGATLQSPTWLTIEDTFDFEVTDGMPINSDTFSSSYNLRTPLKGSLGASYVIAKRAIISADVDFIDYSSIRFSSLDGIGGIGFINDSNAEIKNNTTSAINYRIGTEIKLSDFFSIRGGYGLNGSPYKNDDGFSTTKFYSGGLGYRTGNYYVDLAYQRVETNTSFSPYLLSNGLSPVGISSNNKNNLFLTIGLRF